MGDHTINTTVDAAIRSRFTHNLLVDIKALEWMLEKKLFETNVTRIGAEQEFCLINKNWRPSKNSLAVLDTLNDHHFTTELARYNLEINLDPQVQCHDCLSKFEKQLNGYLQKAETASKAFGDKVLLTGILPTINKDELELEYMTPGPRYKIINELFRQLRGADFEFRITGVDELLLRHESVLLEACNTSFQMHLQIDANDFISGYNWAQAIAGPVLSICTNSPLLFGRELWSETRIALFQQSTDTRNSSYALKDQQARATFGRTWAKGSAAEIFKDDLAQHKIMLTREIENDSLKTLMEGRIPGLAALILHNSTVYRWNRPCYGVLDGKPHLRIENRYIPSGPTIADEIANFAFWLGLMLGRPPRYDDMPQCMDFRDAKSNFIKAARTGKESVLCWDGNLISAPDLILTVLLPIAYDGLTRAGIQGDDIDRFLGIIENRTRGTDGSQWMIRNYRTLRRSLKIDDALMALTKAVYEYQRCNQPVHEWPMLESTPDTHEHAFLVHHIMSTQLFTVNENDPAEFATSVMEWKNIHHLPVENGTGELSGLLTWYHMWKFKELRNDVTNDTVADIMIKRVITVKPDTSITEAINIMRKNSIGCLPVIDGSHLVGIITVRDIIPFDHGESS